MFRKYGKVYYYRNAYEIDVQVVDREKLLFFLLELYNS